jgi:hypothetical protein
MAIYKIIRVKDGQYLGDTKHASNEFGQAIRLPAALTREDTGGVLCRLEREPEAEDRGERKDLLSGS